MTHVIVVGEGRTEETFVRDVLAPTLGERNIFLEPQLIATSRIGRGGALSPQRVIRHLRNVLLQRREAYVTTFFDLYHLDNEFPGVADVAEMRDPVARSQTIQARLGQIVIEHAQCRPERFVPHVQPYEFEALLFSDVTCFAGQLPEWQPFVAQLQAVCDHVQSPEHINDGAETHPSARLCQLLRPRYQKVLHGPAVAARIGLDRIRERCVHFADWLRRIEALQPL